MWGDTYELILNGVKIPLVQEAITSLDYLRNTKPAAILAIIPIYLSTQSPNCLSFTLTHLRLPQPHFKLPI
jgi:hypothetical protein